MVISFKQKKSCYLNGDYYNHLLPNYSWSGLTDEEYLEKHLTEILPKGAESALELACGSGRGTKILKKFTKRITAVDKSDGMLSAIPQEVKDQIVLVKSDMKEYILKSIDNNTISNFDFIFSFWGIFYLIHQEYLHIDKNNNLFEVNQKIAYNNAKDIALKFLSSLGTNANACFFHVRRDTDEQFLNRQMWARWVNPRYNPSIPTPSELIFKEVLEELKSQRILDYSIKDVNGTVTYNNMDNAVETFLNFHSKAYFNDKLFFDEVLNFLQKNLSHYKIKNGKIIMGAGLKLIDIHYF